MSEEKSILPLENYKRHKIKLSADNPPAEPPGTNLTITTTNCSKKRKEKKTQGVMPTCSHHQMAPVRVPPSSPPLRNCSHVRLCRNPSRPEIFQEFASEPQVRYLLFRCGVSPYPGTLATDTFRSTRQVVSLLPDLSIVGSVAFHYDTR